MADDVTARVAPQFDLVVMFDDQPEVTVTVLTRDIMRMEELSGVSSGDGIPVHLMPRIAYTALCRMKRRGLLADGVVVPESFDEFQDVCDVLGTGEDEEPGKA